MRISVSEGSPRNSQAPDRMRIGTADKQKLNPNNNLGTIGYRILSRWFVNLLMSQFRAIAVTR